MFILKLSGIQKKLTLGILPIICNFSPLWLVPYQSSGKKTPRAQECTFVALEINHRSHVVCSTFME